jgi:Ca2+-binding EF-hand superfamily protein
MNKTTLLRSGLVLSFLGGAALVSSLPVSAQTTPNKTPSTTAAKATDDDAAEFARLDKNKDGFIDKTEAMLEPRLVTNFDAADANKDGKIDKTEWAVFQKNKDLVVKKQ